MSTALLTAPSIAPVLPELDPAIGHEIGDEILLSVARTTKVAKVKTGTPPRQDPATAPVSRAWSRGGRVD
jgi:hypothetical protein